MNRHIQGARAAAAPIATSIVQGEVRPDLVRDEVLADIFRATATARADRVALVSGRDRITYGELDRRTDAMARGLVRRGIGVGDVVGLWMPRGPELLVAQIAITKSGAAWLPFDAEAPVERIAVCLADAEAKALVTSVELAPAADVRCPVLTPGPLDDSAEAGPVDPRARGLGPDHPAYLIYTSGSTGTPKGIVVTHRNICHFLRSANELYGLRPDDVVFQGASVAFDLSMEEIWVPYLVGATLFVASPAMVGDAERLPGLLTQAGVTVLDTVPTLLSLLTEEVPSLRLILLGGEALPQPLVTRWARPGRRLFNTYGPTEATVVATAAEMQPGKAVTIGRPIPNYTCYVVDEHLNLVPPGTQGELLIGGPGIARGYLKRPELTAEKFIPNPYGTDGGDPVLYRSGDAVSLDRDGNILFHGRIDDQVKIRGFRVELGEIETRVRHLPGIGQAAVVLRQDDGIDRLVAFLALEGDASPDRSGWRVALREQLPPYMIPSHFEIVETLPRLSSGKIDRKALRALPVMPGDEMGEQEEPRNETEAALLVAAKRVLGNQALPLEGDFFADLGGHSLLAARFVSEVREEPVLASITMQDVYARRTLRALADMLIDRTGGMGAAAFRRDLSFEAPPLRRRFLCGLGQVLVLPFVLTMVTAQWLGVFVTFMLIAGQGMSVPVQLAVLLTVYAFINVFTVLLAVGVKWLVLGRTRPGRYPLWGAYYFRWWVARRFTSLPSINWLRGSPALPMYLRALGATVGRDTMLSDIDAGAIDLVTIADGASVGGKVALANAEVIGNELVIGRIEIGRDAMIGNSCVIGSDAVIGDHAELADLTAIPPEARIGAAEKWDGSPARKVGEVDVGVLPEPATASEGRRFWLGFGYAVALVVVPPVSLLPIFPSFYLFDQIGDTLSTLTDVDYRWYLPLLTWPPAMAMIAVTVLLIWITRWVVLPRVRPGTYSIYSGFYFRKWLVALATEVTLETLASLFATLYMRAWYRLLGAKIGAGAEISTNLAGRFNLTEVGPKNFIADDVSYGDEDVRRGWMHLQPVRTGARVFVGNDAVVPPGSSIPDDTLIGVKSKPPANEQMGPGETWFGSPPIKLPNRQKVDLGARWTYEPPLALKVGRGVFELFSVSFPSMLMITLGVLATDLLFYPIIVEARWVLLAASFVAASVVLTLAQTAAVIVLKWVMIGAYAPMMKPMWSWWALRTESIALLYWGLGRKIFLEHLRGTPFLPWVLRLFGCRFGRGVCMETTDITEFDCVQIGDFCAVNSNTTLQTHLFEDRVMKVGRIELGRGVSIGSDTTVLYETKVGDFARLGSLTIVMKGESIPAHSEWAGAPAVPVLHRVSEAARAA